MDYKKLYEEALEKAREIVNDQNASSVWKGWLCNCFPELKDSENEIRKEIISALKFANFKGVYDKHLAWLEKQGEPIDKGEISDGYHTFNELYYYRMLYNAAFFNLLPKELVHKSKRHHDGEECFGGGWFIVIANLPTGQISNHYELKDWDLFQIPEKEMADEWDGHTPQEAAERLHKYLEKQGGQKPYGQREECSDCQVNYAGECKGSCELKRNEKKPQRIISAEAKEAMYGKLAWSEDDERNLEGIIDEIEANKNNAPDYDLATYDRFLDWLKSLKDRVQSQSQWKPSDEQIGVIEAVINNRSFQRRHLDSLYEQLKKLKGE